MGSIASIDKYVALNKTYGESFTDQDLRSEPTQRIAVITCMDARIDVSALLGLKNGEAHVLRNAGGVVTDDVIRSLCLSQRFLGTQEIMLIHHTKCGLRNLDEANLRSELAAEVGVMPTWSFDSFVDPYEDVRQSIQRLRISPFVSCENQVKGFVYNVSTGLLEEVEER